MQDTWPKSKGYIIDYYNNLIQKHSDNALACDYGRRISRDIKYKVMGQIADLNNSTILDIGCGFGDFSLFLNNQFQNIKYTGFDINKNIIVNSKEKNPTIDLQVEDILRDKIEERYDYVTANGIFYLMVEDQYTLMEKIITKMFLLSKKYVSFNSLSSLCKDPSPKEFYADPMKVFDLCRKFTKKLVLRCDYHERDFTIYMYK